MAARLADENFMKYQIARKEIKELKKRTKQADVQLATFKLENTQLINSLKEIGDLNVKLEKEEQSHREVAEDTEKQMDSLSNQLIGKISEIFDVKSEWKNKEQEFILESDKNKEIINKLKDSVTVSYQETEELRNKLDKTKEKLYQIIATLQLKVTRDIEKEIDNSETYPERILERMSQVHTLESENRRLEIDNTKLFKIISGVKQLRELNELIEDSGGLSFLSVSQNKQKLCELKGEWVPEEISKILNRTNPKKQYTGAEVLLLFNQILKTCASREGNRLERLRIKYEKRLLLFKKRVCSSPNSPSSHRERDIPSSSQSPLKSISKSTLQSITKRQEDFIESICDHLEEFCSMLERAPESMRDSQEWFVDSVIKFLNVFTSRTIELIALDS